MTIRIVTDSSCDLPDAVAAEHHIRIVPLTIRFGDEEFLDREELSTTRTGMTSATARAASSALCIVADSALESDTTTMPDAPSLCSSR